LQPDAEVLDDAVGCPVTDGDWGWMCIDAAEPASAADEVVGTSPTQLEPRDELIRFDHEYYRTAPPPADDVGVGSAEEIVCEVEVSSDEPPADNTESAVLSSVCDLDLSILGDHELWDNLEQIIDADQLLGLCNMPPLIIRSTTETSSLQVQFNHHEPQKQTKNAKTLPIQASDGFDISYPLCDVTDTFSVEPWSSQSSSNDFEASSSGIGSPFSDDLVDSEDFGFYWEESFTELFPALV